MVELKGPGVVYLSAHEPADSHKESHLEADVLLMLTFL